MPSVQEPVYKRGNQLGRPIRLTQEQISHAEKMIDSGQETVSGIAELYGVDRSTIHRTLKRTVNMAKSGDITNIAVGND